MRMLLSSALIAGVLAVVTFADAKSTRHIHGAPATAYSAADRECAWFGTIASTIAVDRDHRVPLSTTNARLLVIVVDHYRAYDVTTQAGIVQHMRELAHLIYTAPGTAPTWWRFNAETGCLDPHAQGQPWR